MPRSGPPADSRDFQKAASQRFTTAEVLLKQTMTLDATYIGGYTVECSLKALILHRTSPEAKPAMLRRISSGASMHRPEVLLGYLRDINLVLPSVLGKRMRTGRFTWSTNLRYETGRLDTGETTAFLKTAKAIYDWVEGQLNQTGHG